MIALGTVNACETDVAAVDGASGAGAVDAAGGVPAGRGVAGALEAARGVAGAIEAGAVDATDGGAVGSLRNTFDAGDAVRAVDVDCVLLDVKFAELIVLAACVSDFIAADSASVS